MSNKKASFWLSPRGLAALGMVGAASYFLLMEHSEHVWQYLPFLILLACPFMHMFMHKSHGHDHQKSNEDNDEYQRGLEDGRNTVENISSKHTTEIEEK
ncbi:MAG: DUF2933 domain-containing protein [Oleispira sp.]|nr:DUF2933 domain-containing protein [Oleispira sp.]